MATKRLSKKKKIIVFIGVLALLIVGGIGFMINKMSSMGADSVLTELDEAAIPYSFGKVGFEKDSVHYLRSGNESGDKLLLIHGSPGDWSAWVTVIKSEAIRSKFDIVAIDRVGYGGTTHPASGSLEIQANAAIAVAGELWNENEYIVVGHSYGGAVSESVAIHDSSHVKGLLIVAGTISPSHQAPRWYNKFADWTMVNAVLPEDFRSSNIEMMQLPIELELNEKTIPHLNQKKIIIHGRKDMLVPIESIDYAKEHFTNTSFAINDTLNHFIPWSKPELIIDAIGVLNKRSIY